MAKWVEYDPHTGVRQDNVATDDGDLIINRSQDVGGLLDRNAEMRNTQAGDVGIKKGLWHYASIPVVVQYEMLTKYGVNIHKKGDTAKVFDLINEHYPYLKLTDKTHSSRRRSTRRKGSSTSAGQSLISTSGSILTTREP